VQVILYSFFQVLVVVVVVAVASVAAAAAAVVHGHKGNSKIICYNFM
jgi:hypothetical protein